MNLDWLVAFLLVIGAFFMLVGTIGLIRMPDLPTRMHATTKAGAFGAGLMLLGVALFFAETGVITRAFVIITFIVLTAPVAAHVIGRAAYIRGTPLWSGTICDQLKGHYDIRTGELEGAESDAELDASDRPTPVSPGNEKS